MTQIQQSNGGKPMKRATTSGNGAFGGEESRCGVGATRTLSRSLHSPAEARAFIAEEICAEHASLATSAVALVTSELVTDAVLRSDGALITITLECDVTTVKLSLTCTLDSPSSRLELGDSISGRIVESIARATGAEQSEHELTRWCTIPTGHTPPPPVQTRRS
jgi:hypothetical protein